jgi:ABC-2 type transport system permease protein
MKKILVVAKREFLATVTAKGFLFGILLTPTLFALTVFFLPRLISRTPPRIIGEIAVLDSSGEVAHGIRDWLSPEKFTERRDAEQKRLTELTTAMAVGGASAEAAIETVTKRAVEEVPRLTVAELKSADIEKEKDLLKLPPPKPGSGETARLALIVINDEALRPEGEKGSGGSYDLFVRNKLDDRLINEIQAAVARGLGTTRLRLAGFDPERVGALAQVERSQPRVVSPGGEQKSSQALNAMLPIVLMVLLFTSVFSSASSLMTTTIEEKSNRVVELLLSTVTAMELMTGKILGQMSVGLLILVLYTGFGFLALTTFALSGLVDFMLLVYLAVFFVVSYVTISAMMATIGAAVSDMRDAQSLMMPVMLTVMLPFLLMVPVSSQPNSLLATTLSFIPPIGSFVTMLRLSTNTPPPLWQAIMAILINAAGAYFALRFAAKVFRIGLLMFGKPPTFGTLIRWAKMAG